MGVFDDDLTDADMAFLTKFNQLGRSDTADGEYNPDIEPDPEGEIIADFESGEIGDSDDESRTDVKSEGDEKTESDDGSIDESKMDISDVESQEPTGETKSSDEAEENDHLESGDSDSEIQDGEDDLEYDPELDDELPEDEDEGDLHDEHGDLDAENSDAKVEEDDGEGERGNSDEQRESDEPIQSGDDDSDEDADELAKDHPEPEDSETDSEREQREIDESLEDDQHEQQEEAKADAKKEMEGDAQQELEDHLQNQKDESGSEDETDEQPERLEEPEDQKQNDQKGKGKNEAHYSDLPDPSEGCSDHCEDNEDGSEHECPRCAERLMRERKEWGVIATDMDDNEVFPGDKLRVEIPMSFFTMDQILTANVPNAEMEREAQKTDGTITPNACWLSGRRISQFTGYHMTGSANPIWTFEQGRKLRFAVKVGEPVREFGGQGDIDDQIEQLKQDLDEGKFNQENQNDDEPEQNDELPETDDDPEDEHKAQGKLTGSQVKRFENLFERLGKKIAQTFGNTAEVIEQGDISVTEDGRLARPITIKSRGVTYHVVLIAQRADA